MPGKNEFQVLIRKAEQAGWTVTKSRGGHLKWHVPNSGKVIFSACTPSDTRAVKNHTSLLRKAGLDV